MNKFIIKRFLLVSVIGVNSYLLPLSHKIQEKINSTGQELEKRLGSLANAYLQGPCRQSNQYANACFNFLNTEAREVIQSMQQNIDDLIDDLSEQNLQEKELEDIRYTLKQTIRTRNMANSSGIAWIISKDNNFGNSMAALKYLTQKINHSTKPTKKNAEELHTYLEQLEHVIASGNIIK